MVWFFITPSYSMVMMVFFGLPILTIAVLFSVFFKDTPISILTKFTPEEALQQFLYIAKFNGKDNPDLTIEDIKDSQRRY